MRSRHWLHRIASVFAVLLLSACTGGGLLSQFPGSYKGSSHYNLRNRHAYSDNAASRDYFNNIPRGDNLWYEIKDNFKLEHYENNPNVQVQLNWFMHNQAYLDRTARRAAPYMYYIYQQVKTRHLPSELVLLPIIESAYNPFVSSSAGAAGLWQLEPGTARNFGARTDWWYDGRRDINASTKAALDYFSYLQNLFNGNWLLAIAAYNTGEGNVASAIRRNAHAGISTDFWSLPVAAETRSYVPRLLALAIIVQNPERYHIQLPPISNSPYLGEVEVSSQITLEKSANLAGVSLNELKTLNPGYKRNTLDPNRPYRIFLPVDRVNFFRENLLRANSVNNNNGLWGRYKIQTGDTWKKLAKQFHTPVTLLQSINKMPDALPTAGQILLIPENEYNEGAIAAATTQSSDNTNNMNSTQLSSASSTASSTVMNSAPAMATTTATETDSDSDSDTNSDAASKIGTPDLTDAANLDKSAMQDYERQNAAQEESAHAMKIIHTVKHGETLARIATHYKVAIEDLARWNHLSTHSSLHPGKKLTILRKIHAKSGHQKTLHKSTHTKSATSTKKSTAKSKTTKSPPTAKKHKTKTGAH